MSRSSLVALAGALLFGCVANHATAQSDALVELYGQGVHRFFAGDLMGADQVLTRAIDSGSQDPRVFYFRGLARHAQGLDSTMDFQQGAQFEMQGKRAYAVGKALTRIQGFKRAAIEKARRDARVTAAQSRMAAEQANKSVVPATPMIKPAAPSPATAPTPLRASDTAADPVQPTVPEISDTSTDPFGDDVPGSEPSTEPGGSPFNDPPAGGSSPFDDPPAGGDTGDPFADPFGDS